jgi:hypothetical protein
MKSLLCILAAILLPTIATAQEIKRAPLADYVAICLGLWDGIPDLAEKADALGLKDAAGGGPNVSINIDKSTLRFFRSVQGNNTIGSSYTTIEDGKESWCDINLQSTSDRADLEALAQALDLDGQILSIGSATAGYWKIRTRAPAVLVRALLGKSNTTIMLVRFEPTPAASRKSVAAPRAR